MPALACTCARTTPALCPRCAPGRYLITHAPECGCSNKAPYSAEQVSDIACYLWGRDVTLHTISNGECPYHFQHGDCEGIMLTLIIYPVEYVRHVLPVIVPVEAFHNRGLSRHMKDPQQIVCVIGDARHE